MTGYLGPVREVVIEPSGLDMLGKAPSPLPVGGGLGAEVHRLASGKLVIGRLQVIEQDPPGHPVDH